MSQSRPKMVDVGRLAGVSAQTVSRFYTGKGYVGAETRRRIEAAIAQLNYQFNGSARSLRVNATRTVGVLTTGPSVHGIWSILQGLNEAAHDAGYALFTSWVEFDPAEVHEALDRFLSARVDGILISSPHPGIEDTLQRVWETVPVVILSGHAWPHADSATVDSYEAALLATRHLTELGHRRILHIAGPEQINEAQDRERGYRDALAEVAAEPLPVVRGDWSAQSGYDAGSGVDVKDFSAVFSGNDQMALGFMNALRGRGLVAPSDYSIAGVDDMPDARHFAPPLTSVRMDFAELGRSGFRMLVERITTGERVARHVIHPHLVPRESTARVTGL
ncbi:LacI family DNA-binding transcriptional regulator [Paractinoplanes atraurantiacus]|uniref:DNA-binding transcriptional regulator, LacI/PurR family n=1 Tax=Paractinoplanes atraurantiacus TaxID=1036182 RepID=A0A285GL37_9ACTN|nr:LacI family DNA-binding transcriptional regulator [Actinoplanes atraurantiacus]SNY24165.1 DNA-binding transcriptional regulator, LacI/PurR family [Actinoplanes atraurantiacus]